MEFVMFHKTGELHDKQGDWDGDEGYQDIFEISNGEVESHVVEMIVSCYFDRNDPETFEKACELVTDIIDSFDLFDQLTEDYEQELQDWAQELYDNQ